MNKIKEKVCFVDSFINFINKAEASNIVLIVDENVLNIYNSYFQNLNYIVVKQGEEQKKLQTIENIIKELLLLEADKDTLIVGVGGGVVCDITGLAASLFMRGVRFGFFPTTLLAMCDAAIGGKNGVNLDEIKNVIGLINQPEFIAIIPDFIKTLPEKEFKCGLGEIIKHAFLKKNGYYEFLIDNKSKIVKRDIKILTKIIEISVDIKSDIVYKDEYEKNLRQLLNFGHTIAHAIELTTDYSHGECVAIGMYIDTLIANKIGYCCSEVLDKMKLILDEYNMPKTINFNADELIIKMINDKKRRQDIINYVFPIEVGKCKIEKISISDLKKYLKEFENV